MTLKRRITEFGALGLAGPGIPTQAFHIEKPLLILYEAGDGEGTVCHIYPAEGYTHQHYGLLICDMVRNIATAYKVDEDDVWEWVDRERRHPTTELRTPS